MNPSPTLRLTKVPALDLSEPRLTQESVMDLARRLGACGWRINVAFEIAGDGLRFTLSGDCAP